MTEARVLRIGLAGLGTVGSGVCRILEEQKEELLQRTGCELRLVAVSARNPAKNRGLDLTGVTWVSDPLQIAGMPEVDVVVEAIGGDADPALSLVRLSLHNKKAVVTANKALLAHHGLELARLSEDTHSPLLFEAAVAGGIPIIKMLREGLAANRIEGLYGILNGTCNYILTKMEETGAGFDEILGEAQKLGYAEADPTLDVDGGDSGHKLVLLTALAFGFIPNYEALSLSGIRKVSAEDIQAAADLGYRIKLVGQAKRTSDGRVLQLVSPCLVPKTSPLAHAGGVLNAILTEGDSVGQSFVAGRGAGSGPTASAVVADLVDLARGKTPPVFGRAVKLLTALPPASLDDWEGEFYLRLVVKDQPGVIAEIAPILRDHAISIESLIQHGRSQDQPVSVIIMTHETTGSNMRSAADKISTLASVVSHPLMMPVLKI